MTSSRPRPSMIVKLLAAAAFVATAAVPLFAMSSIGEGDKAVRAMLEAHGGHDRWQSMGTFTYTMHGFPLSEPMKGTTETTVDLHRRAIRIDGSKFVVAFDGEENAWSLPAEDAAGLPTRFVTTGSSYFIMMPFVFGDPGAQYTDLGKAVWQGETYRAVAVSYGDGVGFSDDDDYVLYLEPETHVLRLIHHTATEAYDPDFRVTWGFDEWQEVDGMFVPAKMTFYQAWDPENPPTSGVEFTVTDAEFKRDRPDPSMFRARYGRDGRK